MERSKAALARQGEIMTAIDETRVAEIVVRSTKAEQAVMVCPQCEGEGGYPDGLDEDACHTDCTRCGTNGWIVDLAELDIAYTFQGRAKQNLQSAILTDAQLDAVVSAINFVLAGEWDGTSHEHGVHVYERALDKLQSMKGRKVHALIPTPEGTTHER
jgi:hypothetical protein